MAPKPKDKGKAAPSAWQPPPAIEDLFTTLNKHIQRSDYEQAVKVADQVLAVAPGDEDAIRCKVVGMIKADNIDDALSTIHSAQRLTVDFSFFKAYCLYRQNKLEEALETLRGQERNSETLLLESQILYRLGKMDACVDVYQKLQKSKIDSLEINFVASLILAGRASEVQGMMEANRIKASSSFELAYNTACSLIQRNKYTDAEQLLLTARRIGQETLMDDNLAEDDIEIELAPIAVQLAYVQELLGRSQEAMGAYTDIINRNLADESSFAVAVNNLVALKGTKDVSDNLRKLDRLKDKDAQGFQLARGLEKLSVKQRETIYANRVLLLLHANKMDQAREIVAALPYMFADSVVPVLLQSAVLVRENKASRAEEILAQFAEKLPDKSKIILLARAQIAAAAGHPQVAADSLSKITDIQHKPATVATIVALKERAGDIDGASAVLDSAIKWWSNAMAEDNKLDVIMQQAASFKIRHGREEEAAHLYEQLVKSHGSIEALAGLVSTVANVNVDKAEAYEKQLKPLPGLKGIDVDSLEKTSGAKHVEGSHVSVAEVHEEGKKEKPKKKRKRKPRYPKGFDPANPGPPPDPERWLPKRERSSYRPKRKDKRAAQVRGSQGAVVREKHEAGASATTSNTSNSKSSQATSSKAAAEQSKPSSKSSRKKSRN
ncbi:signal recognition particle subunit SRP72 [Ricinus communis]|uniref:Signal recognition particle subunit SRP72 n=1 Tax=Ricinus communis TaxID=3988 RepID=B9RMK3_RICCO|nr:signal recognition particle subunit SRP72 [Ricinus communis]EEF47526.1 Signal recognition particle subunit srp72, putative [Ricinus communis]|eukprot:XP_002514972.1 signal recognition particle subunit SRP72 [Ricinus communis]